MYCCINIDPTGEQRRLRATTQRILNLEPQAPDPELLRSRRQAVIKALVGVQPPLQKDTREQLYFTLGEMVALFDRNDQGVDMAIQMGLCHHRLPAADKALRTQRIEALIDGCFGPLTALPTIQPGLKLLRARAPLLPDALMEAEVRSLCGPLWLQSVALPEFKVAFPAVPVQLQALWEASCEAAGDEARARPVFKVLIAIYSTLRPDKQEDWLDFAADPANSAALLTIESLYTPLARELPRVPMAVIDNALADLWLDSAASDAVSPEAMSPEETMQAHVSLVRSRMDCIDDQMMRDTIAALDRGVDMGDYGRISELSLATMATLYQQADERLSVQRLRGAMARAGAVANLADPANEQAADIDPVHAWSVARLVRWIEGPVTRRSPTGRLDRSGVVAREKKRNASSAHATAGTSPPKAVIELNEDDVGLVLADALAGTARFFHDELTEMTQLAGRLGADGALLARCTALLQPLQALASQPAAVGEEDARALLEQAEDLGTELRQSLRATEARTLQARRFEARLHTALSTEPLVLGKRHGGVIRCPLQATDWPWVAARFHRRWLSQAASLVVDGEPVPLRPDQALALYVTASSLSQHAFDISVHLWQRRAGCTSAPGAGPDAFAPMNGQDWFDTYIPCCVLHVPQAG